MSRAETGAAAGGPVPVLVVHYGDDWLRGSETVLLDLLGGIDRDRFRPVIWCNGAAFAAACHEAGHLVHRSDFAFFFDYSSPRFSARRYLALVREGVSLVRRHGIRVIHANSAAPVQWLVPVARLTGRPLLAHLHIGYRRRSRYALLLHAADLIVGVSRHTVAELPADAVAPARLRVVYNGIDPSRLVPPAVALRDTLGIPAGAPVVASVGSLVRRKGHDLLLRAVARLGGANPPHLIIGGDGEARAELEALAATLGIRGRTHFLGDTRDPAAIYRAADIFALASRAEAFGLVLAEAAHGGLPVVATRVGGIPEAVLDGETGLLVAPEDVDGLAAALNRLLGDPEERRRLGAAARRRVEAHFTVGRMRAAFEGIYAELATQPPRRPGWTPYLLLLGLGRAGHRTLPG
ncbi:glycosyltransferase [Roseomonas sp. BN140053]|uniref:glycosyltransferase n=1 Tax=Roseomonas sp. BN140053 TaxID=3391898 RepID=UPI0039EB8476